MMDAVLTALVIFFLFFGAIFLGAIVITRFVLGHWPWSKCDCAEKP